ncbi:CLUMA_CG019696, isoform A [Clunio marinus]|uniref:CLUMA_CG019696, isoform A n=1 Tax=Clunio marinus TaxID=568069 RepID=A0A1J1J468_9DIPT|nr:CLUMA_CG019696, isoform A [Clunio marinus]
MKRKKDEEKNIALQTMERLRLWRYRKLTNENVKDEKVIEKYSDDEDYNSCFKLKRNIKNFRLKKKEKLKRQNVKILPTIHEASSAKKNSLSMIPTESGADS